MKAIGAYNICAVGRKGDTVNGEHIRIGDYVLSRPEELDSDSVWVQSSEELQSGDGTIVDSTVLEAAIRDTLDTWGLT